MDELLLSLLLSLGLTEIIECAFALVTGRRGKALLLCALANLITNPPVVLLHSFLQGGWPLVAALELGAVAVEGLLYRYSGLYERPYRFSLIANALSFSLGLIVNQLI